MIFQCLRIKEKIKSLCHLLFSTLSKIQLINVECQKKLFGSSQVLTFAAPINPIAGVPVIKEKNRWVLKKK